MKCTVSPNLLESDSDPPRIAGRQTAMPGVIEPVDDVADSTASWRLSPARRRCSPIEGLAGAH